MFELDRTGALTVLYRFTGGADGGISLRGCDLDEAGNLYGTTVGGASYDYGTMFKRGYDQQGDGTVQLHRRYAWDIPTAA